MFSVKVQNFITQFNVVFDNLRAGVLKYKPSKYDLLKKQFNYLGHIVSSEGVSADPMKSQAVVEWPRPATVTEVRSFLGLVSYSSF